MYTNSRKGQILAINAVYTEIDKMLRACEKHPYIAFKPWSEIFGDIHILVSLAFAASQPKTITVRNQIEGLCYKYLCISVGDHTVSKGHYPFSKYSYPSNY